MASWYFSYNGKQTGPFDDAEALFQAKMNPNSLVWREGFTDWVPVSKVSELGGKSSVSSAHPPVSSVPPPLASKPTKRPRRSDEIDYKIFGTEMQFVEIELDPQESAIAEAGAMMYKDTCIQMETIFGDGSSSSGGGFLSKLLGAGKRLLTGESLFMTVFTHMGTGKAHVAFASPYPGNIIPVSLADYGGCLICQKDSFLCAAKGVSIGIYFQKKIMTGLFGGEGFIMQKLEGDGMVFIHAGGTVVERNLEVGEVLHVDSGCLVGFVPTVQFDIQYAGGIKTALFGGEGLFFATVEGPGKIWLQSLPFSRLAGRMLQAAPHLGGSREEGSILGGLFNGDNS